MEQVSSASFRDKIARLFEFAKYGTNFRTEIIAGVATFLALSYIFVVNPSILSQGGFDKSVVLFATIVASAVATLLMGVFANKPLVLAPGMEINAFVAFYVIGQLGFTWQQALGAVFWSAVIFIVLTLSGVREKIIRAIPERMNAGLSLCVGVFLGLIALKLAGVLVYEGIALKGIGVLFSPAALVLYFGVAAVLLLRRFKVGGAVLISIILCTAVAHFIGLGQTTGEAIEVSADMLQGVLKADLGVILDPKMLSIILVLFLIDFYGSVAKLIGLTRKLDKQGKVPKMKQTLLVDGAGAALGAQLGTTSIITYVESAVGIGEGGRTGFTAIVCGVLMLLFFLLAPLVNLVPVIATTGVLLWVGIMLFPAKEELKKYDKVEVATLLAMIAAVVYTFAIDKALLVGFIAYIGGLALTGKWRQVNKYLVASAVLLFIGVALQTL
ncbi:MAG: NCS2 family permease [Candidatus Micrarchaeota archaeon]